MRSPLRGEMWLVDLGLAAKARPALAFSVPAGESERAIVALVPHTTSLRNSRFEVSLPIQFMRPSTFDAQSLVTIPHAKFVRRLGDLAPQQLAQVEARVG